MSTKMMGDILEALKLDNVSFAELSRIDGFKGDLSICVGGNGNVVIWLGVSQEAIDTIRTLLADDYEIAPTGVMTYMIDGATLDLPIAKGFFKYKKPHWLPCVLRKERKYG